MKSRFSVGLVALATVGCSTSNPGQPANLDAVKGIPSTGLANPGPTFSVAALSKYEVQADIPESEIPTPEQVKALIPEKLTPEQADRVLLTVPEDQVLLGGDRQVAQLRHRGFGMRHGGHRFHHRFHPFRFHNRTFFSPFFFSGTSFLSPFAFDPFLTSPYLVSPFISTIAVSPFISSFGFNPFVSAFGFNRGFFRPFHHRRHHRGRR